MRLMVNHRLVLIAIQSKSISLEQICYKRSKGIVVTSLHCGLFLTSETKNKNESRKVLSMQCNNFCTVMIMHRMRNFRNKMVPSLLSPYGALISSKFLMFTGRRYKNMQPSHAQTRAILIRPS